jgi:hypothetical protein
VGHTCSEQRAASSEQRAAGHQTRSGPLRSGGRRCGRARSAAKPRTARLPLSTSHFLEQRTRLSTWRAWTQTHVNHQCPPRVRPTISPWTTQLPSTHPTRRSLVLSSTRLGSSSCLVPCSASGEMRLLKNPPRERPELGPAVPNALHLHNGLPCTTDCLPRASSKNATNLIRKSGGLSSDLICVKLI